MTVPASAIETVSGIIIDLKDPKPSDFKITDIAWALSREPRYGGHTIELLPYTVGQHSVVVAKLVRSAFDIADPLHKTILQYFDERGDEEALSFVQNARPHIENITVKLALLHDASEAYLRDLPSPVKNLPGIKEAYGAVEEHVQSQIMIEFEIIESFEVLKNAWAVVHWADIYARTVEAYHLMPSRGAHWSSLQKLTTIDVQKFEGPKPALQVYQEFLEYFFDLEA